MDEMASVLNRSKLAQINQEYNLPKDTFELIRCHEDLHADHFFKERDQIMVYEE